MVARNLVALAVLLALAVPAAAPFSNPHNPIPAPSPALAPSGPAVAPAHNPSSPGTAAEPSAKSRPAAPPPCVPALQVTIQTWRKEILGQRTVPLASVAVGVPPEVAGAIDGVASAAADAGTPLQGSVAPALAPLGALAPTDLDAFREAGDLVTQAEAVGVEAAVVVDEVYVHWTPFDYVFQMAAGSLLPPGAFAVPMGCVDPSTLTTMVPLGVLEDMVGDELGGIFGHQDGWYLSGLPRVEASASLPTL